MKTKREKYIAKIDDGQLISYFHAHTDRVIDRLLSGLSNLQIAIREADMEKVESARDYLVKALEDVSALRFAGKEIYHRHGKMRRASRQRADYIREVLKKDVPEPDEIALPRNFFGVYTKR